MELSRWKDKPVSILFKLAFVGLFLFMVAFIMRLEISNYDSYSYLGMANYNAGLSHYEEPELNTRPPLYPFLLTPVAALQYLGVSPQVVIKTAHFIALIISFVFIGSSYLLLQSLLHRELAALGALLMMIQPGFLVYSFEPMVDLSCSLMLVLASLISFAPKYGWTWKNLSMAYAPFFLCLGYRCPRGSPI